MTCGIYMIKNMVNSKIYIGQAVDIERRWVEHKRGLRGNKNKPNEHLQRAWNKYKEDNFEFTVICECDENQLNTKEIDYIAKLKTYDPDFGYNKTYGGEGGRHTEETRRKQREANKGKNNGMYGKHHSEETRKKISESRANFKGEKNPMFGKHHSEETKQKISESRAPFKGEKNPMYGKHHSEDTKRKVSEANSIIIVQIDQYKNNVVNIWKSSYEAKREGGFDSGAIIKCCKNKFHREGNNIYKGYRWQYLHEYIHNIDPRIRKVILFGKEYEF